MITNNYRFTQINGIKMLELSAINNTQVAQVYCTTRSGGISTGTYESMNCNIYKKLDIENGRENFRLVCKALNINDRHVITNRLVYFTDKVRCVTKTDLVDIYDESIAAPADGLVTDDDDIVLFFYAADCPVITFVDPEKRVIGGLHSGWKGCLIPIIENTVAAMCNNYGCQRENIIVQMTPSIGQCCFEVSEDVAEKFSKAGFSDFISREQERPHIWLDGVNTELLKKAGIKSENIYRTDICTCCNPALFHSYRRGPVDENGLHLNGMNGIFLRLNKHCPKHKF